MSFQIAVFDMFDGKRPIEVVFSNEDDYSRFSDFYRDAIQAYEYDDPRGIEQGWVGKDGRP